MPPERNNCIFKKVGLGEAAKRDVGSAANQVPDMSLFTALKWGAGYQVLPGGLIIQWGSMSGLTTGTEGSIPFPIPFPNAILQVVASHDNYMHFARPTIYNASTISKEKLYCSAISLNATAVGGAVTRRVDGEAAYGRWIAIGY